MQRLQYSTIDDLNAAVQRPDQDLRLAGVGIIHLGLGAFHRAHQAVYTEEAMAAAGGDWGIVGVSLRSGTVAAQLRPQDCLYSVMSEDASGSALRVIGVLREVLVAPEQPERVTAAIASPDIRIMTLTITEKGYCVAADGHSLDSDDAQIRHDLDNPLTPVSALGIIGLGLRERAAGDAGAMTIISCDNLSGNSKLLRGLLIQYLQATFPDVLPWLEEFTSFPCSMVDRIVPASSAGKRQLQAAALGVLDEAALATEPFRQWLIEDEFANGRPAWDSVGVQLVGDIHPYENIKLRLLNACHSAIAYSGLLAGVETVDQLMADPLLRQYIDRLMSEELMPALQVPADFDLDDYKVSLLARFDNPVLGHRCAQIAIDGSEKISQRWLPTLQIAGNTPRLLKALASWCYFVLHTELELDDPRAEQLAALRDSAASDAAKLPELLACARITADSIEDFEGLCATLAVHLQQIENQGLHAMLAETC